MRYLVLDLETNTKEVYGRIASPWHNNIVAIGLKYQNSFSNEQDIGGFVGLNAIYLQKEYTLSFVKDVLKNVDILIGHNIKFDLLYLWKEESFQEWLKQGGKIYDTQLAEYILSGQKHKYPALRDIAVNKYGCSSREKLMEKYWEQGIDTKDIPKELVLKDVENDVIDTEQVMLQQIKLIKKEGMYNLVMEQMEGLLATIEMEYNGIYINQEIMKNNKDKLELEIQKANKQLLELSEKYYV